MRKGMFLLFEGFDGVGKTTLSKSLADQHGFIQIKSPDGLFSSVRECFDNKDTDFKDRLSFYSGVAIRSSIKVEEAVNSGITVLMDRYYYTIIAYHYSEYLSLPSGIKDIYKCLYQPDLIFFIDTDFFTIKERIMNRAKKLAADDKIFMKENKYREITSIYKKILPENTIYIDNTVDIKTSSQKITNYLGNFNR